MLYSTEIAENSTSESERCGGAGGGASKSQVWEEGDESVDVFGSDEGLADREELEVDGVLCSELGAGAMLFEQREFSLQFLARVAA